METHRSMVKAWEADSFGHFTVAYYFERFADASATLREALAQERGLPVVESWIAREYLGRFSAELRAGDVLHIESGVIGAGPAHLRLGHRLRNSASGALCTTVEERWALPPTVRPLSDPEQQRLVDRDLAWESEAEETDYADTAQAGFVVTGRDRVRPGELDAEGHLALASYVHRSSFGCLQLLTAIGQPPEFLRAARRGFSTFEIRLRLEPPGPKSGDPVRLESGLAHLGSSSMRMIHRILDARSGRRLATVRQSGVHFDLEARRSTPLPAELRANAEKCLVS